MKVGQVVAFRHTDGTWNYDQIESIRHDDGTAWMKGHTIRLKLKYLRELTDREIGAEHVKRATDLRQRIAEMFPCICIPPFEDGAHWHDCPIGFRKEVEELVAAETAALRAEIERIKRVWEADIRALRRERDEAREKLASAQNVLPPVCVCQFPAVEPKCLYCQMRAALGAESPRKDAAEGPQ